jgi:hypothetical protein
MNELYYANDAQYSSFRQGFLSDSSHVFQETNDMNPYPPESVVTAQAKVTGLEISFAGQY